MSLEKRMEKKAMSSPFRQSIFSFDMDMDVDDTPKKMKAGKAQILAQITAKV